MDEPLTQLPEELGTNYIKRLVALWALIWEDKYGFRPRVSNWAKIGTSLKSLKKDYSEIQIGALIFMQFNWRGASGSDDFEQKRLEENCFPLEWISAGANKYEAYLRNTEKLEFDNEFEIRDFVMRDYGAIRGKIS